MNLKINHRLGIENVKFFNSFDVTLRYDSVASPFALNVYFDELSKQQAEIVCVSHFHECILQHNGETLITGYVLAQGFKDSSVKNLVKFGGYSKPGVFEDCTIPVDLWPLQTDGLSFAQIVKKIADRFKIKVKIDPSVSSEMNKVIPKSTASETQKIKEYFTELATQREIIISHNSDGDIIFTKANTEGKPLFHLEDTVLGTEMELNFNGQGMHSDITVVKQADSGGGNAGQVTIKNPYVPIVYRPITITQTSGDDITTDKAAKNALAAEIKNNITLSIKTDRWTIDNKIIRPNNVITVTNPKLFLYKKVRWFIESVHYEGDNEKEIATLTCVLPESYNGKTPKNIFVDVHDNFPRSSLLK